MLKCCLGHHPKSSVRNSGKYIGYKTLLWCISGDGPDEGGSCRWVFIYLVLCFRQVPHIIALMHSQSVITTHIFIPSSGIPMHPCLCSRSINSPHFLQLPVSAPLKGLQQPLVTHNWNRVHAFNSSWLVFSDFVFFFLCVNRLQVALHACGIATDMVMEHCVQAGAAFVISPCCYGFIQNAVKFTFPKRFVCVCSGRRSGLFISSSLFFDLALLLGSCWLECFSFQGGGWGVGGASHTHCHFV